MKEAIAQNISYQLLVSFKLKTRRNIAKWKQVNRDYNLTKEIRESFWKQSEEILDKVLKEQ